MVERPYSETCSKPVEWVGSSYKDFTAFPDAIQDSFGFALYRAQIGRTPGSAKPLKGFGNADVLELTDDDRSGTYRAIYTVRFAGAIYVLHAFQKKSRQGTKTATRDIELIRKRLKIAENDSRTRERAKE